MTQGANPGIPTEGSVTGSPVVQPMGVPIQGVQFNEPIVVGQNRRGTEVPEVLATYDISMEGVPDAWSMLVSKLTPKVWQGRQCVLPINEEMPLIPRQELDRVLKDNWGKGMYKIDIRNNGVRKRSLMVEITDDDCPPMTRGGSQAAQGLPIDPGRQAGQDISLQVLDRVMKQNESGSIKAELDALRRELTELRHPPQDTGKTLADIFAATTQQSIKSMELMMSNQNSAAERVERASMKQQELLVQSMTNLMEAMKEGANNNSVFQQKIFEVVSASQSRESEILLKLLEDGRRSRSEDMQDMLNMINVGLNLGSAMSGAQSPEEKMIDTTGKVLEKYLDARMLPAPKQGNPISKDDVAKWAKEAIHNVIDDLKKQQKVKPGVKEGLSKASEAETSSTQSIPKQTDKNMAEAREVADTILDAILAFARDGKPVEVIMTVMKEYLTDEIIRTCAEKPQELIVFLKEWGTPAKVDEATKCLDIPKMGAMQEMLKGYGGAGK